MDDLIARDAALKIELYELEAKKAEASRMWFVANIPLGRGERAELDARIATIRMERARLRPQVVALRIKAQEERGNRLLAALIGQCHAAGMPELVDAARREIGGAR